MPDWLSALCIMVAYSQGFILAGIIWAPGPFWDGVRSVYRFGRR